MTDRERLTRYPDRARAARQDLDDLLDEVLVASVTAVVDGEPWTVPTLFARDGDRILVHGSTGAGLMRALAQGAPATVSVFALDGIVVADTAFESSANYRSAVLSGRFQAVPDAERDQALRVLVDRLVPGRVAEVPQNSGRELAATLVLALPIEEGCWIAKARSGPSGRSDREVVDPWAGVVPMRLVASAPVVDDWVDPALPVPPSVARFVERHGGGRCSGGPVNRALVYSGADRYADPWHDFEQTSQALAGLLRDLDWQVDVRPTELGALRDLGSARLLVVNTGGGDTEHPLRPDDDWRAEHQAIADHVARGGAVLAVHTAANSFPDWPAWPELLGGRWVRGVSGHPPIGDAVFSASAQAAADGWFSGIPATRDVGGLPAIHAHDERYQHLDVHRDAVPLLVHHTDGADQVCAWQRGRVVYDGLGHDARSYASPTHRRFLQNVVHRLTEGGQPLH